MSKPWLKPWKSLIVSPTPWLSMTLHCPRDQLPHQQPFLPGLEHKHKQQVRPKEMILGTLCSFCKGSHACPYGGKHVQSKAGKSAGVGILQLWKNDCGLTVVVLTSLLMWSAYHVIAAKINHHPGV